MLNNLREFVLCHADIALREQGENGAMPSGVNGPYGHSETPLRNTGHWLITWCAAYRLTSKQAYRIAAQSALSYILSAEHRPSGANWLQRMHGGRDQCNGVIGAAWTIEALCCAYNSLGSSAALKEAEEVLSMHCFDSKWALWHRLEVDGRTLAIDKTFNHQLWLAASAARLVAAGAEQFNDRVVQFLDRLSENFTLHRSGVIRHRIRMRVLDYIFDSGTPFNRMHERYKQLKSGASRSIDPCARDIGYHAFNLQAFAALKKLYPEHSFWESLVFKKAMVFARSEVHIAGVGKGNPYAYPYNPVGFEMMCALRAFEANSDVESSLWLKRQLELLPSSDDFGSYASDVDDPCTARSRIYEVVELL